MAANTPPRKRLLGRYETCRDFDLIMRAYREGWLRDPEQIAVLMRRVGRLASGKIPCRPVVMIRAAEVMRKILADFARRTLRARQAGK